MQGSRQDWIGLNRPPRVQITYDVEIGGAIKKVELPLVVGIISDLSGDAAKTTPLALLKDRPFVEIDRDNIDAVFATIKPSVTVQLTKTGDTEPSSQQIQFTSIDDFKPDNLLKNKGLQSLADLMKLRNLLTDLAAKLDGNAELDQRLVDLGSFGTANQKWLASAYVSEPDPQDLDKTGTTEGAS